MEAHGGKMESRKEKQFSQKMCSLEECSGADGEQEHRRSRGESLKVTIFKMPTHNEREMIRYL